MSGHFKGEKEPFYWSQVTDESICSARIGFSFIIIERKVQVSSSFCPEFQQRHSFFKVFFPCVSKVFEEFFFYSVGRRQG